MNIKNTAYKLNKNKALNTVEKLGLFVMLIMSFSLMATEKTEFAKQIENVSALYNKANQALQLNAEAGKLREKYDYYQFFYLASDPTYLVMLQTLINLNNTVSNQGAPTQADINNFQTISNNMSIRAQQIFAGDSARQSYDSLYAQRENIMNSIFAEYNREYEKLLSDYPVYKQYIEQQASVMQLNNALSSNSELLDSIMNNEKNANDDIAKVLNQTNYQNIVKLFNQQLAGLVDSYSILNEIGTRKTSLENIFNAMRSGVYQTVSECANYYGDIPFCYDANSNTALQSWLPQYNATVNTALTAYAELLEMERKVWSDIFDSESYNKIFANYNSDQQAAVKPYASDIQRIQEKYYQNYLNLPGLPGNIKQAMQELNNLQAKVLDLMKHRQDKTAPEIYLNGDPVIVIEVGEVFVDLGVEIFDETDIELSLIIDGEVDTSVEGTYIITYSVSDKAGNLSSITRTVEVINSTPPVIELYKDVEPPTITAPGSITIVSNKGEEITMEHPEIIRYMKSVVANDNVGVVSVGPKIKFREFTIGTTEVVFVAYDAAGNQSEAKSSVTVVEKKRDDNKGQDESKNEQEGVTQITVGGAFGWVSLMLLLSCAAGRLNKFSQPKTVTKSKQRV